MKVDLDPVLPDPPSPWPWRRPPGADLTDPRRPTLRSWWSGFVGDQDLQATVGVIVLAAVAIVALLLLPAGVEAAFDAPLKAAALIGTVVLLLAGAAIRRRQDPRWPA